MKKGIWFYGLSGTGKTYASSFAKNHLIKPFIIDGDDVRKHISSDLDYSLKDRKIQIKRLIGLSRLAIDNKMFPITSSVFMDIHTLKEAQKLEILVVKIERKFEQLSAARDIYKLSKNVVGKDISPEELGTPIIFNSGDCIFEKLVFSLLKKENLV